MSHGSTSATKAGMNSMQMIEATEAGNASGALNYAMEAACLLAEMQRYPPNLPAVATADVLILVPLW